jgi:hypothetical protein
MTFREIVGIYSANYIKHTEMGKTQSFSMLQQLIHTVTAGLQMSIQLGLYATTICYLFRKTFAITYVLVGLLPSSAISNVATYQKEKFNSLNI